MQVEKSESRGRRSVADYVSIITPIYNSSLYMGRTIESVLNQTFDKWELILIDDCSVDESCDIAQKFASNDPRIKLLKLEKNSGAAAARNAGISQASGRYIAFLDSDDMWVDNKLERQIKFMEVNQISFCYTAYYRESDDGRSLGCLSIPAKVKYSDLLKVCSIGCLTAIYDTANLGKIYMPEIRKRQDLGLWLRILKVEDYAYGINEPLAIYRVRKDSISANKKVAAMFTWRLYRDVEKLKLLPAIYYFLHYAVNGLIRSKFPALGKVFSSR
jgi:teichuronic acid biosynthesis glycosyltransferase TuaG